MRFEQICWVRKEFPLNPRFSHKTNEIVPLKCYPNTRPNPIQPSPPVLLWIAKQRVANVSVYEFAHNMPLRLYSTLCLTSACGVTHGCVLCGHGNHLLNSLLAVPPRSHPNNIRRSRQRQIRPPRFCRNGGCGQICCDVMCSSFVCAGPHGACTFVLAQPVHGISHTTSHVVCPLCRADAAWPAAWHRSVAWYGRGLEDWCTVGRGRAFNHVD